MRRRSRTDGHAPLNTLPHKTIPAIASTPASQATPSIGSATGAYDDRLAISPAEAARLIGLGRTTLYGALSSGALRSFKIGHRRLITMAALREWLASAEQTTTGNDPHAR